MARANIFAIAPHAPFLQTLVDRVLDGTLPGLSDPKNPFALADLTIILPTRRARLALADAFAERLGGAALLPDIRTFGGEVEDEEPFLPPFDAPILPKAIASTERRLILARLVESWIKAQTSTPFSAPDASGFANPPNAGEILALADSLGELIDDMAVERVSASALKDLALEGNLSAYWENALQFLEIALNAWPHILAERHAIDGAELRNQRLMRQAETLPLIYGDRPVIAAGSTGSVPATADLMRAIADLPNGALVLPGVDTTLSGDAHEVLLDEGRSPHGHPQFGLALMLRQLGQPPRAVVELASSPSHRTEIVRKALALPDDTAHWASARLGLPEGALDDAFSDVALVTAHTEEEEARIAAIAARNALAEGKTVGIVSPDRNLARRITAELERFEITVDDSAGMPLFASRMGRFARQVLATHAAKMAAVELVGLLRNRAITLGRIRGDIGRLTDVLELALLRGRRPAHGIEGLRQALAKHMEAKDRHVHYQLSEVEAEDLLALLNDLEDAFSPLAALDTTTAPFFAAEFVIALDQTIKALTTPPEGQTRASIFGDSVFDRFIAETTMALEKGPVLKPSGLSEALQALTTGYSVRTEAPAREDIAIWGLIEARLQNPGLMILAGLNEGIWPEEADPGPWLSRGMRLSVGLPPPERRHGLAAHDFQMAMGNSNILLLNADRVGTSPSTPSRLLQRLLAFIGSEAESALVARGEPLKLAVRALDATAQPQPAPRPMPNPPAEIRPRRLSITEVETLIRSPYDLYARHVLKLKRIEPLGEDPSNRERGTLIHEIFGAFTQQQGNPFAPDAQQMLMDMAKRDFATLDAVPERRDIWLKRFVTAAEAFLEWERARDREIDTRYAEIKGRIELEGKEPFILSGRADRVDLKKDKTFELIDFKTGSIPTSGDMKALLAPQLLLEAEITARGGFETVPRGPASALTYVKIASGPEAFNPGNALAKDMDLAQSVDDTMHQLSRLVDAYLITASVPMASRVLPDTKKTWAGEFDHLARTQEWSFGDGEEGE